MSNGQAQWAVHFTVPGIYTIFAYYAGDANHAACSAELPVDVVPPVGAHNNDSTENHAADDGSSHHDK